jgi:hypothetical protein
MEARTHAGLQLRRSIVRFALTLLTPVLLLPPATATARPLNVEFKFTPYLPPAKNAEQVTTVEGVATLELNGVPLAEETLEAKSALVMAQRERRASRWFPPSGSTPCSCSRCSGAVTTCCD